MENNEISRNQEHELIMTAMYDALVYIALKEEFSLESILEGIYNKPYEEVPSYSKEVLIKSLAHINDIITAFEKNMVNWRFSRLNNIIQAILITSYTKCKYLDLPTDKKVVIDLAVRLTKKFAEPHDYKFVNAILDNTL